MEVDLAALHRAGPRGADRRRRHGRLKPVKIDITKPVHAERTVLDRRAAVAGATLRQDHRARLGPVWDGGEGGAPALTLGDLVAPDVGARQHPPAGRCEGLLEAVELQVVCQVC